MTSTASLLAFEEGFSEKPYYDSRGFPTIGIGQLLGPKGTPLNAYSLRMPRVVAELYVRCHLDELAEALERDPGTRGAWRSLQASQSPGGPYSDPRCAIYLSMAYQMGVDGLSKFARANGFIANRDWLAASVEMLDSAWARQTPNRAKRHSAQMASGIWCQEYK